MKRYINIFLFTLTTITLYCQDIRFNKTYPGIAPEFKNIMITDGGYVGVGGELNSYGRISILVTGFDPEGNIARQRIIGDEHYHYYHGLRNSLKENTDGGYSLAGSRNNATNIACLLVKFDSNFDTLWTKTYFDNTDFTVFYNHIETSDGGYALVGYTNEDNPGSDPPVGDILLVKTDGEGNMLWYEKYGTAGYDLGVCIIETPDKGYLIGGSGNRDNYLVKTDSLGRKQWAKNYGNPSLPDGGITNIIMAQDSGYICLATHALYTSSFGTYIHTQGCIRKYDKDFNLMWYKLYCETGRQTTMGSITELPDGRLAVTKLDGLPLRSKLLFLTAEGDSIGQVAYEAPESTDEQALLTIKQTSDNGFIMAGTSHGPKQMWVVKTDSCGCVTDNCNCYGLPVPVHSDDINFKVYPNPAVNELNVEYVAPCGGYNCDIEISGIDGRHILTHKASGIPGKESINISGLKTGNYLLKMGNNVRKVSVIR